ncbi:hypothetical protein N7471_012126 [Penicillium samsonianum]|uniref:uncharacterized protein n=1 Tax=Penicillium samsonianum TaxID=1882272 RepID=UPI0025477264|nr:uncharacterized protein N7471_012126 [Penicillium samsonianum]KAJ6124809.1 hypothetical protein N7471_012126 [Penicillium samsonianum]
MILEQWLGDLGPQLEENEVLVAVVFLVLFKCFRNIFNFELKMFEAGECVDHNIIARDSYSSRGALF